MAALEASRRLHRLRTVVTVPAARQASHFNHFNLVQPLMAAIQLMSHLLETCPQNPQKCGRLLKPMCWVVDTRQKGPVAAPTNKLA